MALEKKRENYIIIWSYNAKQQPKSMNSRNNKYSKMYNKQKNV